MIDLSAYAGKTVAILGLGKTGLSAAASLGKAGAVIYAWDDALAKRDEAADKGVSIRDPEAHKFEGVDMLLLSPGIPHTFPKPHPAVKAARRKNIPVICDIALLIEARPQADIIAVTGTNGKSTTTAMIGHVLENFRACQVGGNIGKPVLTLEPMAGNGTYVLEMSSYQLELTPNLKAVGAVLLNLTPDHIDRHGTMNGYIAAKEEIFARPADKGGIAVIGVDTKPSLEVAQRVHAGERWKVIPVSTRHKLEEGVYVDQGNLYEVRDGHSTFVVDLSHAPKLWGQHNYENAACAFAVIRNVYGFDAVEIGRQILTFPGLPHRQFPVRTIGDVVYINDSKATNADAAARALECFDDIYWIIGGQPKEGGLSGLEGYKPKLRHAFVIGQAADDFAAWLTRQGIPFTPSGTLDQAVAQAHRMAQYYRSGTVLLSPACASFDQFKSFEHRGDVFTDLVKALPETAPHDDRPV